MTKSTAPLAGYIRVSDRAGRSGDSYITKKVQRARIEGWANLHGETLAEIVEEEDVQGSIPVDDRELGRLMRACESGEYGGIVVFKVNRFARNLAETVVAAGRLHKKGARLVAVEDGIDSGKAGGKVVLAVLAALGEEELDTIRANWRAAQTEAHRRGVSMSGPVPFGYERVKGEPYSVSPDKAEAVREAFRRRAEGATFAELCEYLDTFGAPGRSKQWTPQAVRRMLESRVYLGELHRKGQPVTIGLHEALITEAQFQAAQWKQRQPARLRTREGALLSGIVRCQGCRYCLGRSVEQQRNGDPYRDYRCRGRQTSGTCETPVTIRTTLVEEHVQARFLEELQPGGIVAQAFAPTNDLAEKIALREELEAERDEYLTLRVSPGAAAAFQLGLDQREAAIEEARREEHEAREATAGGAALPPIQDLLDGWYERPVEDRRTLLAHAIDAVFVRSAGPIGSARLPLEERIFICWRGAGDTPADMPRQGRAAALAPFPWPSDEPPANLRVAAR